ncbi:hypothetical protein EX30DRAFT_343215 [Ascodesmis nigricans]|uniref:Uncharacterized protein n=1 Tax=Ascodesmis nigricans TaxID=341454 RepID=A0A4S2MRG8_9PEZI|nr:hypothetical protein EX30DRAFT_343215 [Ascodesmis nigricans]
MPVLPRLPYLAPIRFSSLFTSKTSLHHGAVEPSQPSPASLTTPCGFPNTKFPKTSPRQTASEALRTLYEISSTPETMNLNTESSFDSTATTSSTTTTLPSIGNLKTSHTISVSINAQGCILNFLRLEGTKAMASFLHTHEKNLDFTTISNELRDHTLSSEPYYMFDTGGPVPKPIPSDYLDLPLSLLLKLLVRNLATLQDNECFSEQSDSGVPVVGAVADYAQAVKAMEVSVFRHRDMVLIGFYDTTLRFVRCLGRDHYNHIAWAQQAEWLKRKMVEPEFGENRKRNRAACLLHRFCMDLIKATAAQEEESDDEGRVFGKSEAFGGGFKKEVHLDDRSKMREKESLEVCW